jgi:hypothetical protein
MLLERLSPLAPVELRRLTRGPWAAALRAANVIATSVVLVVFALVAGGGPWRDAFRIPAALAPDYARWGASAAVLAQATAAFLLTPLAVVVFVPPVRDGQAFDSLRLALSDRAIVLGLVAARVVVMGTAALAALPVAVAATGWAGSDLGPLLAGQVLVLVFTAALCASSVRASLEQPTPAAALAEAYRSAFAFGIAFGVLCGLLMKLNPPRVLGPLTALAVFVAMALTLAKRPASALGVFFGLALVVFLTRTPPVVLINLALVIAGVVALLGVMAFEVSQAAWHIRVRLWPVRPPEPAERPPPPYRPPVGDRPLWWRERPGLFDSPWAWAAAWLTVLAATAAGEPRTGLSPAWPTALAAAAAGLAVGLPAAVAVAGERERGTLDELLVLPIDREALLAVKGLAALAHGLPAAAAVAACMAVLAPFAPHTGAACATLAAVATHLMLSAAAGLWLSVAAPSSRAAALLAVAAAVTVGAAWGWAARAVPVAGVLVGLAVAAAAWADAVRRFRRSAGGG